MRFMETQVTKRIEWVTVEHEQTGDRFTIPLEDYKPSFGKILYSESGYGVRESGYFDCTEWEVFCTLDEAEARAAEIDSEYEDGA